MVDTQLVTLVAVGGTPVRLADQKGTPYPTTGAGSLVFGDAPVLRYAQLISPIFVEPFGFGPGTAAAPAIFFGVGDPDTGIYQSTAGKVDFTSNGTRVGGFLPSGLDVVGSITTAAWNGQTVTVPYGGTGQVSFTQNGVLYGNAANALGVTAAGVTGQILVGNTGAAPSWSTHSSVAVTSLSFGTTGLTPSGVTTGAITVAGVLVGANGGTGVANTGKTITLGGSLTTSGAFDSTFTMTGATNVTFPTSGTLATTTTPAASIDVGTTTITNGTASSVLSAVTGVTVAVVYGSASAASTLVQRDANQNTFANSFIGAGNTAAGAGGITVLTVASPRQQTISGTLGQTFKLPDATTLSVGDAFYFNNNGSAGTLTVQNTGAGAITTVGITGYVKVTLIDNGTANGSWDNHAWLPSNATWSSAALNVMGNFVIQNNGSVTLTLDTSHNASFGGNISAINGGTIGWTSRSALYATTDGTMNLSNAALTVGARLDFATADTLKIRNRADSADAAVQMGATTMSGALTYGGVTLTNAVTGTGKMVLDTSPILATASLGSSTATTQSQADNSTKLATTAYADRIGVQQIQRQVTGTRAVGTTIIPVDNSIPQNTEGDQYMSVAITPKSATSTLVIEVVWFGSSSLTAANIMTVALFQDSTADALATAWGPIPSSGGGGVPINIKFTYFMTSGTTSSTTFKVRAGNPLVGTTYFNGDSTGAGYYNGTFVSSISVTEIGV